MTDLYLLAFFGASGYVFRRLEIPVTPLILTVVLGAIMENSFRQAMTISDGNPKIFISSMITVALWLMTLIAIVAPYFLRKSKARITQ